MESSKKKCISRSTLIIIILSITIVLLIGYICYDKLIKSDNNVEQTEKTENNDVLEDESLSEDEDNQLVDNSANLDFDFNELSNTLHSSIKNQNYFSLLCKCSEIASVDGGPPSANYDVSIISSDAIDTIVKKLKSAKSLEKNITYSWFGCPPNSITYYVSGNNSNNEAIHTNKVFSLNYANADNILLVGYNKTGYAFSFNSSDEIKNFIENLK